MTAGAAIATICAGWAVWEVGKFIGRVTARAGWMTSLGWAPQTVVSGFSAFTFVALALTARPGAWMCHLIVLNVQWSFGRVSLDHRAG